MPSASDWSRPIAADAGRAEAILDAGGDLAFGPDEEQGGDADEGDDDPGRDRIRRDNQCEPTVMLFEIVNHGGEAWVWVPKVYDSPAMFRLRKSASETSEVWKATFQKAKTLPDLSGFHIYDGNMQHSRMRFGTTSRNCMSSGPATLAFRSPCAIALSAAMSQISSREAAPHSPAASSRC